jgi:hypothetical protein
VTSHGDLEATYREGKSVCGGHIVSCVRCLNNKSLSLEWFAGKVQLVTCATPSSFNATVREIRCNECTGVSIRKCVVDCPWLLVRTLVGCSTGTARSTSSYVRHLVIGGT